MKKARTWNHIKKKKLKKIFQDKESMKFLKFWIIKTLQE